MRHIIVRILEKAAHYLKKGNNVIKPPPKTKLELLIERGLRVGKNFHMQDGVIIDPSHCWHIEIGDNVTLAPRVHILAHDASTKMHLDYTRIAPVKIGNSVFIGAGSIVLPGITIGNNVIIGAGAVVTKDVADDTLVAGNPAKMLGKTSEYIEKQRNKLSFENCYDETYTIENNVSDEKKDFMVTALKKNKFGFIK